MSVWLAASRYPLKQPGPAETWFPWVSTFGRRGPGLIRELTGNPKPVETEESDPRAWPAFGLGVDSPGATRICSLLARGTCRFGSLGTKSSNGCLSWVATERDGRECRAL